jgi:dipeptidyl aminopeptidase/acylaminoacyl peptidase
MMKSWRASFAILLAAQFAIAQAEWLAPPATVKADGIPNIPASLGKEIASYLASPSDSLVGWDPGKEGLIIARRQTNRPWALYYVGKPLTGVNGFCSFPNGGYDVHENPRRRYFVFEADPPPGDERIQLYGYDTEKGTSARLTDGKSKNYYPLFSNSGDRMLYSSTKRDGKHMDLYCMDPLDTKTDRMVASFEGEDFAALDWSPDDRRVLLREYLTSSESYLWLLDVATGIKTRLLDAASEGKTSIGSQAQFSGDAKGVYFTTDRESDFERLAYLDIDTKRFTYLSRGIDWDVEQFALTPGRGLLAFTTNEDGFSRLHVIDLAKKNKEVKLPELPEGVIKQLKWDASGERVAFDLSAGGVPGDIYSIDVRAGKLQQWTKRDDLRVQEEARPELIKWPSFDGRSIPGFLYRPPAKFRGPRPVIIDVHGGPSLQYRPGFRGAENYFTSELGTVIIYPNVRGSSGYGKTYVDLDNGRLRQNAIRDVGALLDWVKKQPDLDASRVLIRGESYGGYVALSVATNYADRIAGAISISGPSNLVTDLERTDASRQDRRRAKYGDERDPEMRRFLNSIAPVTNSSRVTKPLLIVQGRNDTRVVAGESEQMVTAVRKTGIQVWYLLALYEGHRFGNGQTIHFSVCTQALFAKTVLGLGSDSAAPTNTSSPRLKAGARFDRD